MIPRPSLAGVAVFGLLAALVLFGIALHHTHIHCIRGAHPAIVLEACAKVQK